MCIRRQFLNIIYSRASRNQSFHKNFIRLSCYCKKVAVLLWSIYDNTYRHTPKPRHINHKL